MYQAYQYNLKEYIKCNQYPFLKFSIYHSLWNITNHFISINKWIMVEMQWWVYKKLNEKSPSQSLTKNLKST